MLNHIWFGLIFSGIVCAACTGRLPQLATAVMDSAGTTVQLALFLLGSMCLWLGFLRIAEESGLSRAVARWLSPVIDRLFPEYRDDPACKEKICMNLTANVLGLGNAATPLGLSAMQAMEKHRTTSAPTRGQILFVVINTASLQVLPINMAAMRAQQGSTQPFGVLPQIWMTSFGALTAAVLVCKLCEQRDKLHIGQRR